MWVLFLFSLQHPDLNPLNFLRVWRYDDELNLIDEAPSVVTIPLGVCELSLLLSLAWFTVWNVKKGKKKKILKSLSIIQIRWAGKDHRRLSCLCCVSECRWEDWRQNAKHFFFFFFIFWGMSPKLLAHSHSHSVGRPLPLHRLHLCPYQCQCVMRKCLCATFALKRQESVGVGEGRGDSGSKKICNLIWSSGEDCWGSLSGTGQGWLWILI